MPVRSFAAAALACALGSVVSAAQPPKPGDAKPDTKPGARAEKELPSFELRTQDETVMKVSLLDQSLVLNTKFGKLTIPASEVRRIEFGFRFPEGAEEKITKAIENLGAEAFRTREDAEQVLADFGHLALPALRRAGKSDDAEVQRRARAVAKVIEGKLGEGKSAVRDYDVVETTEFTVKGRLDVGVLKLRTKYFGETTVKLTDIRGFRSVGNTSGGELALDAAKYAKMGQGVWMETGIEVTDGTQLEITATGRIDQWPQQPGQYMVGPDGQNNGGFPGQPRIGSPGAIMGRVGASGTPFVVGSNYKGKTSESGQLFLRVVPSPWNCDSAGTYKVTVKSGP
jgi:hypothetical protein